MTQPPFVNPVALEVCDDGIDNDCNGLTDGADPDCASGAFCGDGVLDTDAGEQCDDGNNENGDGCSLECQIETVETDSYSLSTLEIVIEAFGVSLESMNLSGPTTIEVDFQGPLGFAQDTDDDELDQVPIELVSMDLVGFSPVFGNIRVTLDPSTRSMGEIEETVNNTPDLLDVEPFAPGTADSFIDLFFVFESDSGVVEPEIPLQIRIQSTISFKPAAPGETYRITEPLFIIPDIAITVFDFTPDPLP